MPKLRTKSDQQTKLDDLPPPKRTPVPLPPPPKGWQRGSDALDRIEAVTTIFPDFNRATRVGGLPLNRMIVIHGPTHGGKTAFLIGLLKSFLDGGHSIGYVDAEHSTPQEFVEELIGELQSHPEFYGSRPETYEQAIDAVGTFLGMMCEKRKANPRIKSMIGVDSINKLTPSRELASVLKEGGKEVSKGHAARYRAAVNKSWLDHLSPRLKPAGCAMVFIAQEREGEDEPWSGDGGAEIKGGQALSFDASMLIRVSKAYPLRDPQTASKEWPKGEVIGFQHRVRIYKSKVSHMDGNWSDCIYHFSNGRQTPGGFDIQRDAIYVGKKIGLINVASGGGWISYRKQRWQGESKAAMWLVDHRDALLELLAAIESKLAVDREAEHNSKKRAAP